MSPLSCVVDEHPRFHLDALRWFSCLTVAAGVDPSDLIVHVVGSDTSDVLDYLRVQGVTVRPVDRFDARSPHCNKIAGALRLAEDRVDGTVALCDTDLGILEDPRQLALPADAIAGKPVDAPVPPLDVLVEIFTSAGVTVPPTVSLPWSSDDRTLGGNNNGGLYLVPGPLLPRVATAWAHWATWLLDRIELLDQWSVYIDQVAMSLGLAAEGVGSVPLDARWNTPTHDPTRIPAATDAPAIVHYHQEVDEEGRIRPTGNQPIDERIAVANRAIDAVWSEASPDASYRLWRDELDQEADASRRSDQRALLASLLAIAQPDSVLEVGCGIGGSTYELPIKKYVGITSSTDALMRARTNRAEGEYFLGTITDHPIEADLTVCLDLLPLQSDAASYRNLVEQLWHSSLRCLVVAGYESAPDHHGPRNHFHEPVSVSLRRAAPEAEIYPIGRWGAISMVAVVRPPDGRHPRDYGHATLAPLVDRHPDPLALMALRFHAWQTTRFYPDHAPRLWEYPVVARLITDNLPPGSRLIDVGAGVTPLAPFLTGRGFTVDTVDPSPRRREWPPADDWNEWDFLDYGAAGLAHRSWNGELSDVPTGALYHGAYSVSVIEHVPAGERRVLLNQMAVRTRPGGLVVLTIDLVRGGDDLWNRNLGVEVEDPALHGTLQNVVEEGAAVGLELFHREVVRDWGDVSVDIGLLAMRKTDRPSGWRRAGRDLRARVRRLR